LAVLLIALAASAAAAQPAGESGPRRSPPRPAIDPTGPGIWRSRSVETTAMEPNALARARALTEAAGVGAPPAAPGRRPALADNSTFMYFPPVRHQPIGDCTCWSSAYYYNTYTQARDEQLNAASDNPNVLCSPRFLFCLISKGHSGAEGTEHAMTRLSDVGCASVALHPFDKHWTEWPTEAGWIQALQNRTATPHKIRADSVAGLELVKQHIANGNCVVSRCVLSNSFHDYPDNATPGIDNRVWYSREGGLWYRHSLCIVGYDDNRPYVDHRDGQTHHGAFLIVNSEGPRWGWYNSTEHGSKGFFWLAYTMFLEYQFGYYNDPWPGRDPSYDNALHPEVYYNDDRPHYRPRLYAVVGVNHPERNKLTLTGGIAHSPRRFEFTGPEAIEPTDTGTIAIKDDNRVAIDLTDGAHLISPRASKYVFVALSVDASAKASATITSADFFADLNGDGLYSVVSSTDPVVTVAPGKTGYAVVRMPPSR
jgi:hypothetical protein